MSSPEPIAKYVIIRKFGVKYVSVNAVHFFLGSLRNTCTNRQPSTFINAQSPIHDAMQIKTTKQTFIGLSILGLSQTRIAVNPRNSVNITLWLRFVKIFALSPQKGKKPYSKYTNGPHEIIANIPNLK